MTLYFFSSWIVHFVEKTFTYRITYDTYMIFENLIFQDFYYLGPSVAIIIIDIFTVKKSTLNKKNTGIILSVIFLMVSVEYH
jgi:hypothetical protein